MQDVEDILTADFEEYVRRMRPRQPRYRYWESKSKNSPMFCYSTEKIEDRYASFVYVPNKKGTVFTLDDDSISTHHLRKDGKARAYKLYQAWLAGDKHPW